MRIFILTLASKRLVFVMSPMEISPCVVCLLQLYLFVEGYLLPYQRSCCFELNVSIHIANEVRLFINDFNFSQIDVEEVCFTTFFKKFDFRAYLMGACAILLMSSAYVMVSVWISRSHSFLIYFVFSCASRSKSAEFLLFDPFGFSLPIPYHHCRYIAA